MMELGWLLQPAAFPWVALVFGLCIGSFLNVVIHRLPRMMERAWREEAEEILKPVPDPRRTWRAVSKRLHIGKQRTLSLQRRSNKPYNLVVPRSGCPAC